jgi:hypothetical protein
MKKNLLFAIALLVSVISYAQTPNGFVGLGNTDPKAKLHITSDTSGLLIPKYATLALANSNSLPKLNATDHKGLLIYVDEAANQGFWFYDGTAFIKVGSAGGAGFFKVSTTDATQIIYTNAANYGKNFIVNADSTNYKSGTESKMYFSPSKNVFRAGQFSNKNNNIDTAGAYSVAFGKNNKVKGQYGFAHGADNNVPADYGIAMGNNNNVIGNNSMAFGQQDSAIGLYSIAVGSNNKSRFNNTTTIGNDNTADNINAIAMGNYNYSKYTGVAIGFQDSALNYYSTAIGTSNKTDGQAAVGIGQLNKALSSGAVAIGSQNYSNALYSVAIGASDSTLAFGSVALGSSNKTGISGTCAVAMGASNYAQGISSFATGFQSHAEGRSSVAMGYKDTAISNDAIAIGDDNKANTYYAIALGNKNYQNGAGIAAGDRDSAAYTSTAIGALNKALGTSSIAMGQTNEARGFGSVALGATNKAFGDGSVALGNASIANSYGETVIGSYNDVLAAYNTTLLMSDTNRIFTVGNGTGGTRKTAFVIQQNGNVGVGSRKPTSTLEVAGAIADNITTAVLVNVFGVFFYTMPDNAATVLFDATSGTSNVNISLPDPATCKGRHVTLKKIVTNSYSLIVRCTSGSATKKVENVDGSTGYTAAAAATLGSYVFQSDGTSWWLISKF